MERNKIVVKDSYISIIRVEGVDYISLTDIAKFKNIRNPGDVIIKWMSNKSSFDFYCLWEELFNENFKLAESREFKNESSTQSFTMSPSRWIEMCNSKGFISKRGKYEGGTFAHPDIAFEFASWIDTSFKLYLIKEFQRLKELEGKEKDWSAKRELAKVNYHIHTGAIKENLIVPMLTKEQIYFTYASEADLLNVALFGLTASEWRKINTNLSGNMRDYASIEQLLVLANMESYNAMLIDQGLDSNERIILLNKMAIKQTKILEDNNGKIIEKCKSIKNV